MHRVIDRFDLEAIQEGYAVQEHREMTIRPRGRDDNRIRSNHMAEQVNAIHCRSTIKHSRNGKEINLQSINAHKRHAIRLQENKIRKMQNKLDKQI